MGNSTLSFLSQNEVKHTYFKHVSVMNEYFGTSMTPESDFQQINSTKEILRYHQNRPGINSIITKDCTYPKEDKVFLED